MFWWYLGIYKFIFDAHNFPTYRNIPRRMELVSAPGEAYNSSSRCGKVDFDMSSVGRPNLQSHVFYGFRSFPTRFGKDFQPRASLRAMFKSGPRRAWGPPEFYFNIAGAVGSRWCSLLLMRATGLVSAALQSPEKSTSHFGGLVQTYRTIPASWFVLFACWSTFWCC